MKYSWIELMFADRWQWVRRRAAAFWVRELRSDGMGLWVKFSTSEMAFISKYGVDFTKFKDKPEMQVEDWRPASLRLDKKED